MWHLGSNPSALDAMALGAPIASTLKTVLNQSAAQSVRTSLILGDPTLRAFTVKPVTGLSVTSGAVLTWSASGTSGAGYWVYATTTTDKSSWTRLTTGAPLTALTYTHSNPSGVKFYQVRGVALQASGRGSFTNLSVGAIIPYP